MPLNFRAVEGEHSDEHSNRVNVYGPTTARNRTSFSVKKGTNVTLNCPMGGFPLGPIDDIIWKKDGNVLNNSFTNFTIEDIGLYTCTIGSATAEIYVYEPTTVINHTKLKVFDGSNVTLNCPMGEFPLGPIEDIVWKKNGNLVRNSYLNFTTEDAGIYTCTIGSATAEIDVWIQYEGMEVKNNHVHVTTERIFSKFIEVNHFATSVKYNKNRYKYTEATLTL